MIGHLEYDRRPARRKTCAPRLRAARDSLVVTEDGEIRDGGGLPANGAESVARRHRAASRPWAGIESESSKSHMSVMRLAVLCVAGERQTGKAWS
jgi:hypothetical protein